jgi:hypothetical protein
MDMEMYPQVWTACVLDSLDQVKSCLRLDEGSHVLDADGVHSHILHSSSLVNKERCGVYRADGVRNRSLSVAAGIFDRPYRGLDVSQVIEGIEYPEDIDAVFRRFAAEAFHHLVLVMAVPEKVLTAKQHLQRCFGHEAPEGAQPFPRVFIQVADAGVIGGSAPALYGPVTGIVKVGARTGHIVDSQPGGYQALVSIPKGELGDINNSVYVSFHC